MYIHHGSGRHTAKKKKEEEGEGRVKKTLL